MAESLFVTRHWLAANLKKPDLCILDARMLPPGYSGPRNIEQEFSAAHLPNAAFFNIEALSDTRSPYPHMLLPPAEFAGAMSELGVNHRQHVIIYDEGTLFSAPRAWWMLRNAGVKRVSLLAGGLAAWQREGRPLEQGAVTPLRQHFESSPDQSQVRSLQEMQRIAEQGTEQIVDARSAERFTAQAPEPRPGLRRGHIPGSLNLPWNELVRDGCLKPAAELQARFEQAGVDLERPIVASCGSGVTAAVLLLALTELGANNLALYDGSWGEWGSRNDLPVAP